MTTRLDLIALLKSENRRLRQEISQVLSQISLCLDLDSNLAKLPKLVASKNACGALLRAAQKNDFMLLKSDGCNEIDAVKQEVPEISQYVNYILKKRQKHKAALVKKFKSEPETKLKATTLPALTSEKLNLKPKLDSSNSKKVKNSLFDNSQARNIKTDN